MKPVAILIAMLPLIGLWAAPVGASELPALHRAVLQNQLEHAGDLLKDTKANNPNQRDQLGSTPLHLAVRADNVEMVKLLISKGANGNITDGRGQTAMDLAKSWSIWWMLLRSGALPGIDTTIFLIALGLLVALGLSVWLRKVKTETALLNEPDAYLKHANYKEADEEYKDAA